MFGKANKPPGADLAVPAGMDMSARPRSGGPAVTSLISNDLQIIGNIVSAGEVQFDGVVEGDIQARRLTIGKEGIVKGNVRAVELSVLGRVEGSLAGERVDLKAGCVVMGNIVHKSLSIESGAKFSGRVDQSDDPLHARVNSAPAEMNAAPIAAASTPQLAVPQAAMAAAPAPAAMADNVDSEMTPQ